MEPTLVKPDGSRFLVLTTRILMGSVPSLIVPATMVLMELIESVPSSARISILITDLS